MHKFYKPNEDVTGIILIKHFLQQGQDKKKKMDAGTCSREGEGGWGVHILDRVPLRASHKDIMSEGRVILSVLRKKH